MTKRNLTAAKYAPTRKRGIRSALMLSTGALALISATPALAQTPAVGALPVNGHFVGGAGTIDAPSGGHLQIDQTSDRAVINWDSFDIGQDASVDFDQQAGDQSIAVNRVIGSGMDPSLIFGELTANGTVVIINGNGVIFGGTSNVDVGRLVATTSGVTDADVMDGGDLHFSAPSSDNGLISILSGAHITVADAGLAAFVGPRVSNAGTITARGGRVVLASGVDYTLDFARDGLLEIALGADSPLVTQAGQILAEGGLIQISAAAAAGVISDVINVSGTLSVTSATLDDGVIVLSAGEGAGGAVNVSADLTVSGDIEIDARRIRGAGDVDVTDGELALNLNVGGADTTAETLIADALAVIGSVDGGTTLELGAGDYRGGAIIATNNVTVAGTPGARIVLPTLPQGQEMNGLTISADNVTIRDLAIVGPALNQSWLNYGWNAPTTGGTTRGIAVWVGADNFAITDNAIQGLRTGIVIDGRNAGGSATGNLIDNTKSAISVQYTDAGLLNAEGFTFDISDNDDGQYGNEWGINFHLNGHLVSGTPVANSVKIANTASGAVQAALLAWSAANNGMSAQDQGYNFANRTHVNVAVGGGVNSQGSLLSAIGTIQGGIDAVVTGGTVNVGDGTYALNSWLLIDKSVSLIGQSQAGTILDATGSTQAVIKVQADDVALSNFTVRGGNEIGIKVEASGPGGANARRNNFSISDVTINGGRRTGLDLNAVIGAVIDGVTVTGVTNGNGMAITDSANVTIRNSDTSGNAWGGLALYQTNGATGSNQQLTGIVVEGSNSFGEAAGLYMQDSSALHDIGALSIAGFDHIVHESTTSTVFQKTLADAEAFALGVTRAAGSSIEGWTGTGGDNDFNVVAGLKIQNAIRDARTGGAINVGAGAYADTVTINKGLTLHGAGMEDTFLTGGITLSNTAFANLTLQGFTLSGDGGGNALVRNGRVTNLTVDDVRFDGGSVAGRHGFAGGQFGGAISITNSEFLGIRGFSAFDTSTGGTATAITSVNFSDNLLDGTVGHVTFRQATPTADVLISGNTVRNVGDTTDLSSGIFKVFGAATVDFVDNNIDGIGGSPTKLTAGVNDGAALLVRGVGTLNITDNIFSNNQQAFLVGAGNALPTVTNITGNTFDNNAYDIFLPASTGGVINFGAGNDFISGADTVAHFVWVSSSAVDMTGVKFNGEFGSAMSDADLFVLEDRIYHGVDANGVGLVTVKADHLFATPTAGNLNRAVNLATDGDTVNVANGTHNLGSTRLIVDDSITLVGQSEAGTIIDGRGLGGGLGTMLVSADGVSLSNFTLYGADSGVNNFGIKVQPDPVAYATSQRLYDFSISDVTVQGSTRAELDLNGVVGAHITNFTANGYRVGTTTETGGAGVQITDSQNIYLSGVTTLGNAWGSVAIYQTNKAGAYDALTDNINIDGTNSSFAEFLGVFVESYSTLHPQMGELNLIGFDYAVTNPDHRTDGQNFTFFRTSLDDAIDFAVNLNPTESDNSLVQGFDGSNGTGHYYVGTGDLLAGGTRNLSIQTAFNGSSTDDTVHVASGDYAEALTLNGRRTVLFGDVGVTGLTLTSGADESTLAGDLTAGAIGFNFASRIYLADDLSLTTTGGGAINLARIDGTTEGGQSLTIVGSGSVGLQAAGSSTDLASLDVEGVSIASTAAFTTGSQRFHADTIDLAGYYQAGGDFTADGAVELTGDVSVSGAALDAAFGSVDGAYNLYIQTNGGDVSLGAVGANEALASLNVGAATIATAGAATTGDQTFSGVVTLDGAYSAHAFGADAALLGDDVTIDADADVNLASIDGAHDLDIDAEAVNVGSAGATTALASLTVEAATIEMSDGASVSGALSLMGAADLAGAFTVGSLTADGVALIGDLSIDADGGVTLAAIDGAHALTIDGQAVTLGALGANEALANVDVTGTTIVTNGAVTTGTQSYDGALTLNGAYAASDLTAVGAATLGSGTSINATGDVALATVNGAHDLSVEADGSVTLDGIGATQALTSLDVIGATIVTAGATTTGAQTYDGALTLDGAYAASDLTALGAVTLGGDASVNAEDVALGTINGAHALTVDADGAVTLGGIGATQALASLDVIGATIVTAGASTTGAQSYDGALTLDGAYAASDLTALGAVTLGGDASVNAEDVALGSIDGSHALSVEADGSVTLGAIGANEALASVDVTGATIVTNGAITTGAQSYDGALTLNGAYAASDLTALGAVTLGGAASVNAEDVALGTVNGAHALSVEAGGSVSLGGVGATQALASLDVIGATIATNGAVTTGAQSYDGAVSFAGDYLVGAGDFTVAGATTLSGDTLVSTEDGAIVLGSVDGSSAGGQSLTLDAGDNSASVGDFGANVRLGAVLVHSAQTVLQGNAYAGNSLAFTGGEGSTVRLTRVSTTFNTTQSDSAAGDITIQPHLIGTTAGAQSVVFIAGSGLSPDASGNVTLGNAGTDALRLGAMTATGGDFSAATVKLAGDYTSLLAGDQVFTDETLDTQGDVVMTVAGNESGSIHALGSVFIQAGGSAAGNLIAGGPVTLNYGTGSDRSITSDGDVSLSSTSGQIGGSITSGGAVAVNGGDNVSTTIVAGSDVSITTEGGITSNITTPGQVALDAGQLIDVTVDANTVTVNAPGGSVDGVFTGITTPGNTTLVVNGEAIIGDGNAAVRQILIDNFLVSVGGIVGSSGQIQLPVGLAIALIAPAGEGEGQRRPIIVNDIERLGELLRLGYTAIVVQIDEGDEPAFEEELDLAEGETTTPAA